MPTPSWPAGRRAAFSLTYDDGVPVHYQRVAAQLAARGLHGTFYLCPGQRHFIGHEEAWASVAILGHELGNHTLFHPCRGEPALKRTWLDPGFDLCTYSRRRWNEEVRLANHLLSRLDGRPTRSFGNTCHDLTVGSGADAFAIADEIGQHCLAARGGHHQRIVDPAAACFGDLGCFGGDRTTAAELLDLADRTLAAGGWAILCCHGVGPEGHGLFIDADEHDRLVAGLAERRDLWCAPVAAVAAHLQGKTW